MSGLSPSPYVTFEAFLENEEASESRHEWLDGVVYDMSRGTPEHARLSAAVAAELRAALKGECVVYGSEAMLSVAPGPCFVRDPTGNACFPALLGEHPASAPTRAPTREP
jgi:Uma2 family endonuclease